MARGAASGWLVLKAGAGPHAKRHRRKDVYAIRRNPAAPTNSMMTPLRVMAVPSIPNAIRLGLDLRLLVRRLHAGRISGGDYCTCAVRPKDYGAGRLSSDLPVHSRGPHRRTAEGCFRGRYLHGDDRRDGAAEGRETRVRGASHRREGEAGPGDTSSGALLADVIGVIVHDHWKPYFTMEGVLHALCNGHHLRELQALMQIEKEKWAFAMVRFLQQACHMVNIARRKDLTLKPLSIVRLRAREKTARSSATPNWPQSAFAPAKPQGRRLALSYRPQRAFHQ
jgi:hypothetical protein